MPSYQYKSLTANGESRTGVLSAVDRADAVRVLLGRGETATSIVSANGEEGKAAVFAPAKKSLTAQPASGSALTKLTLSFTNRNPVLKRSELTNLIRELATAIEAGLPLMNALRTIRRQAHGRAMPVVLDHLIDRVEAGDPLYVAAKDYGAPFDDMIVGMLRAADASGEMSEVMHQLADLLERSGELKREILGATFYPIIVACLLVVSVIVLVTVLVPRLIGPMMATPDFTMPMPTQILLTMADFLGSYWYVMLLIIAVVAILWWLWSSKPANRLLIDRIKLKSPVLGRLLRDVAVARFTRTLGTLISSGLPILDALRITRNTLGNAALGAAVDEVQDQVTSGKALADPLERSGLFPALLIQVVDLGERSGRLDKMLLHAAGAFDRQVNISISLFTKALPPLLLVVMACAGGFVLAAILLPLLEMQSLVG